VGVVERFEAILKRMNVAQHTGTYTPAKAAPVVHGVGGLLFNGLGRYVRRRLIPVKGQPFAEACEVTVTTVPGRVSNAAYKRPIMIPVEVGGRYRVSFYCRSEKGAEFNAIFQKNGTPYTAVARTVVQAGTDWRRIELTGTAKEAFAPGGSVLTCHLGKQLQTVQFADVRAEKLQ